MNIREILDKQKNNSSNYIKDHKNIMYYSELYDKVIDISMNLRNSLTTIRKPILIYLPNGIEYVIAYFSVVFADKVIMPVYIKSTKFEIVDLINYSGAEMIITDNKHLEVLLDCANLCRYKIKVYNIESNVVYCNYNNMIYEHNQEELRDVVILLSTSGTTEKPKSVMLTHKNLLSNIESNIMSLNLTKEDKVLIVLPMCFGYCNTSQLLTHIFLGTSIVIMPEPFLAKTFFDIVEKERVTTFTCVPTLLYVILQYNSYVNYDVSSLRYICFGGTRISDEAILRLINRFPDIGFIPTYGQTEASPRITMLEQEYAINKLGSVGKAIPNVSIRIVDESGRDVLPNQVGEIVCSGNNIMKGYFKAVEETEKVIKEGWLYTGDIGYMDDLGFLYLMGRKKNIIKSGGMNIYPEEVENIIRLIPEVKDVVVIAKRDDLLDEIPHAIIVSDSPISEKKLKQFCKERISTYKVPKSIEFVNELNKTYNGKTIRKC